MSVITRIPRTHSKLTHSSNNLGLHAVLVLEAGSKVSDAATAVTGDIGDLPDVVEHVTADEEKDGDETSSSPDVAVLDDGQDVGPCDERGRQSTDDEGQRRSPAEVVDGALHGRRRTTFHVASEPGVDLFGSLGAVGEVISDCVGRCGSVGTGGSREVEEDGSGLQLELLQDVSSKPDV